MLESSPAPAFREGEGCRKRAPETETAHTLISGVHGWRLTIASDRRAKWYCPACWRAYKSARDRR